MTLLLLFFLVLKCFNKQLTTASVKKVVVSSFADPPKPPPILEENIRETEGIVEFINNKTLSNGNPVRSVQKGACFKNLQIVTNGIVACSLTVIWILVYQPFGSPLCFDFQKSRKRSWNVKRNHFL